MPRDDTPDDTVPQDKMPHDTTSDLHDTAPEDDIAVPQDMGPEDDAAPQTRVEQAPDGPSTAEATEYSADVLHALEADLTSVLKVYETNGPLAADNVLVSVVAAWQKHHPQQPVPLCLGALRFILIQSVDPNGEAWRSPTGSTVPADLPGIVCCWADFMGALDHYPMQKRALATRLLNVGPPYAALIPQAWRQQAEDAQAAALRPPEAKASAKPPRDWRREWARVLEKDPDAPQVMRELLDMIGLDEVKQAFVAQYHRIRLAAAQGDGGAASYNVRFEGNPGTGKTTVARHYGTFLQQLKVLPDGSRTLETSGAGLINKGVAHLEQQLEELKEVGDGVIFVDEAYQLVSDREGRRVLDFVIPLAEGLQTDYGSLVWVFAGYTRDMEKLFEHNPGLPSRFPLRFQFEDYEDAELLEIFKQLLVHQPKSAAPATPPSDPVRRIAAADSAFDGRQTIPYAVGGTDPDAFGNVWTWDGGTWHNKYGNSTGYGPVGLGSRGNPLVCPHSHMWYQSDGVWRNEAGEERQVYPGRPIPKGSGSVPRERPFRCSDERHAHIAMARLGRQRGRIGFGNARAVRTFFDQVRERQADRIIQEQSRAGDPVVFVLEREDLLGPPVSEARLKSSGAYQQLMALEGLAPVKESIDALIRLRVQNEQREEQGTPLHSIVLNRIFLGNPGTGKTTVAKIYGRLLAEMGLLSRGDTCTTGAQHRTLKERPILSGYRWQF